MLVVGIHNTESITGYDKSMKHRRAEELVSQGHAIQILSEQDFMAMVEER